MRLYVLYKPSSTQTNTVRCAQPAGSQDKIPSYQTQKISSTILPNMAMSKMSFRYLACIPLLSLPVFLFSDLAFYFTLFSILSFCDATSVLLFLDCIKKFVWFFPVVYLTVMLYFLCFDMQIWSVLKECFVLAISSFDLLESENKCVASFCYNLFLFHLLHT